MKIVISESQHSRLLNLLNENPVPAVIRRLKQLKATTSASKKIVDPLDDIIQSGIKIEIDLPGGPKELKNGDEILDAFLLDRLNDNDHMMVTRTIFMNTDDPTLINAIANTMVNSNDALKVRYKENPLEFSNSMKNFYGENQGNALVKAASQGIKPKISSEFFINLD